MLVYQPTFWPDNSLCRWDPAFGGYGRGADPPTFGAGVGSWPELGWVENVRIPFFQVDAFTAVPFGGNPAAVCLLPQELPEALMQAIAAENNVSETAFLLPQGSQGEVPHYGLRWFTPTTEVDLCGHATLAGAHVLFTSPWDP